jgi:2,4-dienoyl-CoA reductase-like NADH-dependent reductase (Old Yellow Enzyme family)
MQPTSPTAALFQPITINRLALGNRVVLAPMAVLNPRPDGSASAETIAFLAARARGGVGMMIVSACGTQRCSEEYGSPMLRFDIEAQPGARQ